MNFGRGEDRVVLFHPLYNEFFTVRGTTRNAQISHRPVRIRENLEPIFPRKLDGFYAERSVIGAVGEASGSIPWGEMKRLLY